MHFDLFRIHGRIDSGTLHTNLCAFLRFRDQKTARNFLSRRTATISSSQYLLRKRGSCCRCMHDDMSMLCACFDFVTRLYTQACTKDKKCHLRRLTSVCACIWTQILPSYVEHMQGQKDTLLSRIFGLFRIQPNKSYYIVMNNVTDSFRQIHQVL